jgi:hypothetical protein
LANFRKSSRRWPESPREYRKFIKGDGPSKPKEGRPTSEAQETSHLEGWRDKEAEADTKGLKAFLRIEETIGVHVPPKTGFEFQK